MGVVDVGRILDACDDNNNEFKLHQSYMYSYCMF